MVDVRHEAKLGFTEAEPARRRRDVSHRRHEPVDAIRRRVLRQIGVHAVENHRDARVERALGLRSNGRLLRGLRRRVLRILDPSFQFLYLVLQLLNLLAHLRQRLLRVPQWRCRGERHGAKHIAMHADLR